MRRIRSLLPLAPLILGACREAVPPWGNSFEVAKRNADNAFAAFAFRFYTPLRDAKFGTARTRMGRYALIPSRLFGDSAIWSTMVPDSVRALYVQGALTDHGYQFSARPSAAYPDHVGDERHFLQLTRLGARGSDDYEWVTHVDHGIGPVRAQQVGAALGTLFTAFEGVAGPALLADTRATFPRTARHLGQLFTIDSLRSTALADGSTAFALHVAIAPDSLRARYPWFATYLDKYVMPSRGRLQLTDRAGATFADIALRDGHWTTRLRARGGRLVSLAGPPRPMPDSLQLRIDATAKFMIFRVGFHDLVGDFAIERGEHTRAWAMQFRREPKWDLPLATERLIRSPLRRPFEGRGSELRLAVRDDLGNQAMSVRQIRIAVRESAIMRWLGGLGATAFGDFTGNSEVEENRFLYEMFAAMRLDVAALDPLP
ncbi:MAG: hypothetical protein U0164_02790 [Gemmatimonadaceae bacterium]